ncbi:MAG: CopG family transcriptional regulator [Gammaproteobacteria bacterium]
MKPLILIGMSKRLQVLLDDAELREIQRLARQRRVTVAEWVRQALRDARRQQPRESAERKLAALRATESFDFPSGDIDEMNAQIESGYAVQERRPTRYGSRRRDKS